MNTNKALLIILSILIVSCSNTVSQLDKKTEKIEDIWHIFPAAMGDDQAWISYNHSYSKEAENDKRNNHLRVSVKFNNPTPAGMPTNEEFPFLQKLDEALDESISNLGGVYVGRITVAAHRYFYFYTDTTEEIAKQLVTNTSDSTGYDLEYLWELDKKKEKYWEELFPTADDWQVIQDLKVLDTLEEDGDNRDIKRTVDHWAYFSSSEDASNYIEWLIKQGYSLTSMGLTEDKKSYVVKYSHICTMHLNDITHHTISSNRKAKELNGEYDGWETSVEK